MCQKHFDQSSAESQPEAHDIPVYLVGCQYLSWTRPDLYLTNFLPQGICFDNFMPHKVFNTHTTGEWHFSGAQGVVVSLGLNRESRLLLSVFNPQISVDVLSMNIVINSIYTRYSDTVFKRTALPSIFILVNNIRCIQHQPSSSDTSKLKPPS